MSEIVHLNSLHLNYLTPLLKWRVMDLESLRKECSRVPKYHNFYRVIRNLQKKKILEGYLDPYSRKKFIYLSSLGERQLSLKDNPTALSKDTLIHDIRVSEITRGLLEHDLVDEVELEHQIHDKRNFQITYKVIPDAILHMERKGHKYRLALELELTRKNNQRLVEKVRQYECSDYYHYIIYLFPGQLLMQKYMDVITEKLGSESLNRIMFFYHENLSQEARNLDAIQGIFKGKKLQFKEVFGQK
jgi:hypothetical protein